jgi:hypothetical protein
MFFSGKKAVLWVHQDSFSIFLAAKKTISASFYLKLDTKQTPQNLKFPRAFLKEKKIKSVSLLVSEPLSGQQSFVYDASAEKISRSEIVSIARSSFSFDIDNPHLSYDFHQKEDKTVIRVTALNQDKLKIIQENIQTLGLKIQGLDLLSSSLAKIFSRFHPKPFIVLFALNKKKTVVLIAHQSLAYSSELKNQSSLKIQPAINQVKMFFETGPLDKIFFQSGCLPDLPKDSKLFVVDFTNESIAQQLKFSKDLPLPVLGTFLKVQKQLIKIKPKTMTIDEKNTTQDLIKIVDDQGKSEKPEESKTSETDKTLQTDSSLAPESEENQPQAIKIDEPDQTEEAFKILSANQKEKSPKTKIVLIIIVSALVTIGLLTLLVFKPFSKEDSVSVEEPLVQTTPTELPSPTPLPTPVVLYEAKIRVENATSISGLAGTLSSELKDLNFESVTAGNAQESSEDNVISCKESYQQTATFIQESLKDIYPASISADLEEDNDYNIILTIGQDLKEKTTSNDQTEEETLPQEQE